jgi:uncharacterized protein (TIGR00375 family)
MMRPLPKDTMQRIAFADFHLHSRYSRATSENMDIPTIVSNARLKGLGILGTGDFTHPDWMEHLKSHLVQIDDTGLYITKSEPEIYFLATAEVCTIFRFEEKTRKIHHLILSPSLDVAEQVSDRLATFGDLEEDGRPILKMSAPELVETVVETSKDNIVIPAHAWTPWFSLFGSINGFDSLNDCYQDETQHISALETGLSSDPPMNWRLSALDNLVLISNSDAHSPYPYRIGREANALSLEETTYGCVMDAIRRQGNSHLVFTVETEPAYGKYHWSGHRNCDFSVSAEQSRRLKGICPVCHKPLTRGVEERIDSLSDRKRGFRPQRAVNFRHLLPLQEIIAQVVGVSSGASASVWNIYKGLIAHFGNEYKLLLEVPEKEIADATNMRIAQAILKVRNDEAVVIPGYDGVYGVLDLSVTKAKDVDQSSNSKRSQAQLTDFMPSKRAFPET